MDRDADLYAVDGRTGVILGYNSATDTANETPSLAFKGGTSVQSVVDRLGLPSQRWLRREYACGGARRS